MNLSLTPQLEAMIRAKVDSGMYNSASEVVREALRIMEREESRHQLEEAIQIGIDQANRGETIEVTSDLLERVLEAGRENARRGKPIRDIVKP